MRSVLWEIRALPFARRPRIPDLLVVYATTEGQTRKVAQRIGGRAQARGWTTAVVDATDLPDGLDPGRFDAVVAAGSLHVGRHQAALGQFVRSHRAALQDRPGAFVSVSLAAAGDEQDRADALACAEQFLADTGWRPGTVQTVAGALRYSQYDVFRRWILRRIAREKGAPTDRDAEFTDRPALDAFTDRLLGGTTGR